jgi:dimethylaniline monooxygenase (N-oxide forming)
MFSNRRRAYIGDAISTFAPQTAQKLFDNTVRTLADSCFDLDPEWNFKPAPSLLTHRPLISDRLVDHLRNESIISVGGLKRFIDERVVELADGSTLKVDVVLFSTGYTADFSLMPENSPIAASDFSEVEQTYQVPPLARLYKNIFLPSHPDSIAYLSNWTLGDSIMPISDLASMAITQVWKGTFALPSEEEMNRDIDTHHTWARMVAGRGGTFPEIVKQGPWINWLNDVAGTGVNEKLGYGLQGWLYWLWDSGFCSLLMTGVDSPHILRLFDGRRKSWVGARDAILRANKDAQMRIKEHQEKKKLS